MSPNVPHLFDLIATRGARLVPSLLRVGLVQCPEADLEHSRKHRQYMHFGHHPHTVCYADATEALAIEWKIGLVAHELGHAAARELGLWEKHAEGDANRIGSAILGSVVGYRGKDRLEWAEVPGWLEEALREARSARRSRWAR